MANPFYVPRRSTTSDIANIVKTGTSLGQLGLDLYKTRQQQALSEKELGMRGQELDIKKGQLEVGRQQANTAQQRANTEEDWKKVEKAMQAPKLPIKDEDWMNRKAAATYRWGKKGISTEAIEAVFAPFDAVQAGGHLTGEGGLVMFSTHQEDFVEPIRVDQQKKLDRLLKEGHVPGKSPEVDQTIKNLALIKDKKLGMAIFPRAYGVKMAEKIIADEVSARKIAETQAGKEQYGKEFTDKYGNIVQRADTGKLTKVSGPTATTEPRALKTWVNEEGKTINLPNNVNPPEGYTPYDQSSKIEERQNKIQEIGIIKQTMGNINRRLNAITKDASLKGDDGKPLYPDLKTEIDSLKDEKAGQVDRLKELLGKTTTKTTETTKATEEAGSPPVNLLKEGIQTTFKNGQVWTLRGGKAVRIK